MLYRDLSSNIGFDIEECNIDQMTGVEDYSMRITKMDTLRA